VERLSADEGFEGGMTGTLWCWFFIGEKCPRLQGRLWRQGTDYWSVLACRVGL